VSVVWGPAKNTATDLPDHPLRQLLGDDAFRQLMEQDARNRALQAQGNQATADASGAAQAGGSQHPLASMTSQPAGPAAPAAPIGQMPTVPWGGPFHPFQDQPGFVGRVDNGGEWRGERPGIPALASGVPSSGMGMEMPAGVTGARDMQEIAKTIKDSTPGFDWREAIQKIGSTLSQANPKTTPAGVSPPVATPVPQIQPSPSEPGGLMKFLAYVGAAQGRPQMLMQMQAERSAQQAGRDTSRIQQQGDTDPAAALQQIDVRLQNPQGLTEDGVKGLLVLRGQYATLTQRRQVLQRLGLTGGMPSQGPNVADDAPQLAGPGVGMQTAPSGGYQPSSVAPAGAPGQPGAIFQDPARMGFILAAHGLMDFSQVAPMVQALKGKFSMHDTAAGTIILDEQTGNRVQLSGVKPVVTNEGQSLVAPNGRVLFTAPKTHTVSEGASVVVTQPNAAGEMEAQTLLTAPKTAPTVKDEPASSMGKLVEDSERAARIYGKGSPQHKALLDVVNLERQGGAAGAAKLTEVRGVRQEFTKLSGDFITVRDAHNRVTASANNPTPAGDLSLLFNYMKILDPGSVVRESEFAQAARTGSLPQQVQAWATRLLNGERLTPEQRGDFVSRAGVLYQAQLRSQRNLERSFGELATRSGMKSADVVIPFAGDDERPAPKGSAPTAPTSGTLPPAGAQGTAMINGRTIRGTVR
jgi:hypothetical protein